MTVFPYRLAAQGQYIINHNLDKLLSITIVSHDTTTDGGIVMLAKQGWGNNNVVKLNKQNKVEWVKLVSTKPEAFVYGFDMHVITALPDGGFLLAGAVEVGDFVTDKNMAVIRFDAKGGVIWSKTYTTNQHEEAFAVQVVGQDIHVAGIAFSSTALSSQLFYTRLSLGDGAVDRYVSRFMSNEVSVKGIAVAENGMVYICGEKDLTGNRTVGFLDVLDQGSNFTYTYGLENLIPHRTYPAGLKIDGDNVYFSGTADRPSGFNNMDIFLLKWSHESLIKDINAKLYTLRPDSVSFTYTGVAALGMAVAGDDVYFGGHYDTGAFTIAYAFQAKLHTGTTPAAQWGMAYGDKYHEYMRSTSLRQGNKLTSVGTGHYNIHTNDIYVIETTLDGKSGCNERAVKLNLKTTNASLIGEKQSSNQYQFTAGGLSLVIEPVVFEYEKTLCPSIPPIAGFRLNDTALCLGDSIHIDDTSKHAFEWKWAYNDVTSIDPEPGYFIANNTGLFQIMQVVKNPAGSDTAYAYFTVYSLPKADAGEDRQACKESFVTLKATGGHTYLWLDGIYYPSAEDSVVSVRAEANRYYRVKVFNEAGCEDFDSLYIEVINPVEIAGGFDTTVCQGTPVILSSGGEADFNYLWSTGDTSANITVNEPGIYTVTASNECFSQTAAFTVDTTDCRLYWYAPNAFTVNSDSLNDGFHIVGHNIERIEMKIYNRWGELVFEQTSESPTWKGIFNGSPAPEGEYIYTVVITSNDKKKQFSSGTVMLLR